MLAFFAIRICGWMERRHAVLRLALHAVYLISIPFLPLAGLGWKFFSRFNNYEAFKLEASVVALVVGAAFFASIVARMMRSVRVGVAAPVILTALTVLACAILRGDPGIHQTRSLIRSQPYPATLRLSALLEANVLDRLFPLSEIEFREVAVSLDSIEGAALSESQAHLDSLTPNRRSYNVLWIAIDALRADHCGAYGYARDTTPNIDALAAESVLFEHTVTPTPASNMAYSAVLNGVFGRTSPAYFEAHGERNPVPEGFSVAGVMRRFGRSTEALTSFWRSTQDRPDFAVMKAGFDGFNVDGHNAELDAREVTNLALDVLERQKQAGRPFFTFIHYIDPHAPYTYHDDLSFEGDRTAVGAYDTEIAYCDGEIGRLLTGVVALGLRDNTVVVLFADHGESFGEHNDWRHGASLRQHQAHVPLMIRMPGVPPKRISQWTTLADLLPTTFAMIGARDPYERLGRDLTPLITGATKGWVDFAYAERPSAPSAGYRSKERAVWSGDLKMSWEPTATTYRVHDLSRDPLEDRNIFDPSNADQGELAGLLKAFDTKIDGFWGEAAIVTEDDSAGAAAADQIVVDFESAVTRFVDSRDPGEAKKATAAVIGVLRSKDIRWSLKHHHRLGEGHVERLGKRAEELLLNPVVGGPDRGSLVLILLFADQDSSVESVTEAMASLSNQWLVLRCALFRAGKGDATVKPILEEAYKRTSITHRLALASALWSFGSSTGESILRGATWSSSRLDSIQAISALAATGDCETLFQYAISDNPVWKQLAVEEALLAGALRHEDGLARIVLSNLASSGSEGVAELALNALKRREPQLSASHLNRLQGSLFQARESIRYNAWSDACASFQAVESMDHAFVGPYWFAALRSGIVTDDGEATAEFLVNFRRTSEGNDYLSRLEERCRSAAKAYRGRPLSDVEITARLVEVSVDPNSVVGTPVSIELELVNGEAYHFGGDLRGSLCLALSGGGAKGLRSLQPLPIGGLLPDETRRVTLWTRLPVVEGSYQPDVVLVRSRYERNPKVLVTLRPIPVQAR